MNYFNRTTFVLLIISLFVSCKPSEEEKKAKLRQQAEAYLTAYSTELRKLYTAASEANWVLNTRIVEGDTITQKQYEVANEKFAAFLGSLANIDSAKKYIALKEQLTLLQGRQFQAILYAAGGSPENAKAAVKELIKVAGDQTKVLYGFEFRIDKKPVTKNDIHNILTSDKTPADKLKAWTASKEVGKPLKPGLEKLRKLRNETVQGLGYNDFFSYQVSDYGMTREEMLVMTEGFINDVWPLYRELHTWARYELAKKYKQPVPEYLPAHWLPNQWGQEWSGLVKVEGINIDDTLKKKNAEWIVRKGEEFYQSLGFPALPSSFYEKSSLYPLPPGTPYKKNNHASAWHIDLDQDVRSLMSVEANSTWWETSLHELGHIYYYISYSRPDVPYILRGGANRAYHEAIGSQIGLASLQKPLLQSVGLIPPNVTSNDTLKMLADALSHIPLIPWGAGVMTRFEDQLYAGNLPADQFNKKWWELVRKYQGIVPPTERGEEFCDACTKTHIIDDPAQYYDYSMAEVLLFQFHDHVARNILKQDVHATNYWGSKEVGSFLKKMMETGSTIDWREHLKTNLGTEVSAKPMVDYFAVLMEWLKKQNKGRKHTLPEKL